MCVCVERGGKDGTYEGTNNSIGKRGITELGKRRELRSWSHCEVVDFLFNVT